VRIDTLTVVKERADTVYVRDTLTVVRERVVTHRLVDTAFVNITDTALVRSALTQCRVQMAADLVALSSCALRVRAGDSLTAAWRERAELLERSRPARRFHLGLSEKQHAQYPGP
jgi:hypothetical protein